MKKELKINMSKLSIGGMEKALVDLINNSDLINNYNITLLLVYNSKVNYLDLLPKNIKLDLIYKGDWNVVGKIKAILGLLLRLFKALFKKYDASICYSHHHQVLALLTRLESKNSIVFIHTDLENSRTKEELAKLCRKMQFAKFKKVVCVSERAKTSFKSIYPNYQGQVVVANNYIDGARIIKSSKDKIALKKSDLITFLNVARHEEAHKKISRIIKAGKRLNDEGYKFRVLLVGDGKDSEYYQKLINDLNLNNIKMLGSKSNPFPYYKISDAFVFSSCSEGYGVVLNEARVLNIPIITTDVADAKIITNDGYGILCDNSDDGIYEGMKAFLKDGYKIKRSFDYLEFNKKITKAINEIVKE